MYDFDPKWLGKVQALRDAGVDPYPNGLRVTHTSTELHAHFNNVPDPAALPGFEEVCVGGRVMFRNRMGRAMFLRLHDRGEPTVEGVDADGEPVKRGGMIQIYLRRDEVGDDAFAVLKKLDIGDFLWVRGHLMRTRTGELTVQAHEARLAAKTMSPMPDRWHGVADVQTRSRRRYVDLLMNAESREVFRTRSRVVRYLRDFFHARDYLEAETPMMHVIPGGAAARPFITHHNTFDLDLYLRIAPELYLKRLVVGGFERVFELNRNFRNEGVSVKHNPEFTMLEFYQAWATHSDLMDLTEELIVGLADEVLGSRELTFGGMQIDLSTPWRRAEMDLLISEQTELSRADLRDPVRMADWYCETHTVFPDDEASLPKTVGKWWELLFDEYVEPTLINPTFVVGFPTEISPLSRRSDADPDTVERFELFMATWEIANAFSELNDPVDQAGRFAAQVKARDEGDEEGMYFDADYIDALCYGMPPTAGEGIGIDRLVMLLTGRTSIREVILFPTLRPL